MPFVTRTNSCQTMRVPRTNFRPASPPSEVEFEAHGVSRGKDAFLTGLHGCPAMVRDACLRFVNLVQ
jgi:hypothetical protein